MLTHVDNRITYSGNGNATEFAYQFKILDRTDIKVLLTDADGKEKLLTKDYYVDVEKSVVRYPGYAVGAEVPEGERPAVLPTGWKLTIYREVLVTQETDLPDQYPFNQVEDIGDKLTMIAQQLTDTTGRSLKISVSTSADIDTTIPFEAGKSFRIADDGKSITLTEDPARVREIVLAASDVAQAQARVATAQATAAAASANAAKVSEQNAEKSKQRASDLANEAAFSADRAATQSGIAGGHAAEAAKSAEEAAEKLAQLGEHEANAAASAKVAAKSAQDAASVERRTQENAAAAEEHATAAKQNAEYTATLAKESSDAKDTILSESNSMRQYMSLTKENIDAAKNQTINAAASAGDYAAQAASSQKAAARSVEEAQRSTEEAYLYQDIATTEASKAAASAKQAQGYADSVKDVEQELRADNARLTTDLKHANRRISVLYDLGKGITHRYETDNDTAYSKDVPSGAKVMDVKMVGGKSVAAHQYIDGFAKPLGHGYKYTDDNDYYNVTFTTSNGRFRWISLAVIKGHKYYQSLILQVVSGGSVNGANYLGIPWNFAVTKADGTVKKDAVISCTDNGNSLIQVSNIADSDGNFATCRINKKSVRLIDLTQMFGAGNEPTLEQCREIFVNDYYPYNAGTLVSADVTDVQVGDKLIQLPNSISLKSAGSVYDSLEFYEQDGKYYQKHTQRVGVVDLGTLTWNLKDAYGRYSALNWRQDNVNIIYGGNPNMLCAKYSYKRIVDQYKPGQEKGICIDNKYASASSSIYVDDCEITNLKDFTTAMQGVLLYYELATPIVTVTEIDNRFDAVDVSTGDKVTFVGNSDYHLPVPNEQEYLIALNEVTP
nr:MAG TPA: tail fiber protein [Bacteriophage sp.]